MCYENPLKSMYGVGATSTNSDALKSQNFIQGPGPILTLSLCRSSFFLRDLKHLHLIYTFPWFSGFEATKIRNTKSVLVDQRN